MAVDTSTIRIDRTQFQHTLEKRLSDLPPLPAAVVKIMQTINNPNTTAEELNNLIRMDQGLASKVLRIVNSAYYGLPKKVSTITQAVMILGFNTVRNLVMGVGAFGAFQQKTIPYGLNREQFWEHSVGTAVCASVLAKRRLQRIRNASEEAFIGGLLHDVGTLFLDCYFPVQYAVSMAFAEQERRPSLDAERLVLGIDHLFIGRKITEHWNFPSHLVAMVGNHHPCNFTEEHQEMVWVVHAGDWLCWQLGHAGNPHARGPQLNSAVEEWLGFSEEMWESVRQDASTQYAASASLIQVIRESR